MPTPKPKARPQPRPQNPTPTLSRTAAFCTCATDGAGVPTAAVRAGRSHAPLREGQAPSAASARHAVARAARRGWRRVAPSRLWAAAARRPGREVAAASRRA
eukprot:4143553-Prymnesium_polylepis.1